MDNEKLKFEIPKISVIEIYDDVIVTSLGPPIIDSNNIDQSTSDTVTYYR